MTRLALMAAAAVPLKHFWEVPGPGRGKKLLIVTLAVGGLIEDQVITELVRRTAIAVQDHDAFAALT